MKRSVLLGWIGIWASVAITAYGLPSSGNKPAPKGANQAMELYGVHG